MNNDNTFGEKLQSLQTEVNGLSEQVSNMFNEYINPMLAKSIEYNKLLEDRKKNQPVQLNYQPKIDFINVLNELESERIRYLHERITFYMKDNKAEDIEYFKRLKMIKKELIKLLYSRVNNVMADGYNDIFSKFFKNIQEGFLKLESRFDSEKYSQNNITQKIKKIVDESCKSDITKSNSLLYLLFRQIRLEQVIDRFYEPIIHANKLILFEHKNEEKKLFNSFIQNDIFPFVDHGIDEIANWYKKMPDDKRVSSDTIMEVRTKIMEIAGIKEMQINEGTTTFDRNFHIESAKDVSKQYPRNVIMKITEKGYYIADTNELIRKARVVVNYR